MTAASIPSAHGGESHQQPALWIFDGRGPQLRCRDRRSHVHSMSESAAPVGDSTPPPGPFPHLAIAEQGKVYALAGQHALALAYYREAIRLTVQSGEPEIVFRHYLECVLESLEKMGAYRDVLDYCEKAVGLLKAAPETAYTALERAHVYQRQGAVQLKAGDRESAAASLRTAVESAASHRF